MSLKEAWLECRKNTLNSAEIAEGMMEKYPELVDEWLMSRARVLLSGWVQNQEKTQRRHPFSAATEQLDEDGDTSVFLSAFQRRAPFIEKYIGDLRRADINEVIQGYSSSKREAELHLAVWRRVHKKVGLSKVSEVYTEEQFDAMFGVVEKEKVA